MVAQAFNPRTWEADTGGFLSSRPAWTARATQRNPASKKKKKQNKQTKTKEKRKQRGGTRGLVQQWGTLATLLDIWDLVPRNCSVAFNHL